MARGNQPNAAGNSNNPFKGYQTFYYSLFSNVHAPDEEGFQRGVNDEMIFKSTLQLDNEMQNNSAIMEKTDGKNYFSLPKEKKVSGFLKSISVVKDTIKGKPTKQIEITLFDPEDMYYNPFEKIDTENLKNGTVTGAIYKIKTAFTLKGKELIGKLYNLVGDAGRKISISIVPANSKESGYKEQIFTKEGKKVYNILVKQGDTVLYPRFGDPAKNSFIVHDTYNEKFLQILEEEEGDSLRVTMDKFHEKYINEVFRKRLFDEFFIPQLNEMGYDLVDDGKDKDGNVKLKYVRLGEHQDATAMTEYVSPEEDEEDETKSFRKEIEEVMPPSENEDNGDDLPF